jgi:RNA recognition motif-containing protein
MKIYVGNLSYQTTEDELKKMFEAFGSVISTKIIMDPYTRRSRGFGFVEMTDTTEAQKAIEQLHGSRSDSQTLVVNEARPQSSDRGGSSQGSKSFNKRY